MTAERQDELIRLRREALEAMHPAQLRDPPNGASEFWRKNMTAETCEIDGFCRLIRWISVEIVGISTS